MTSHKLTTLACGFLGGILFSVVVGSPLLAQAFVSWSKREVVPVVLVEPAIGGFAPVNGSAIGNIWPKDRVVPMCKSQTFDWWFRTRRGVLYWQYLDKGTN